MKAYKVKGNKVIEVECEKMEWPLKDSEGDTIYDNTHFKRKRRAYENAISNCEAKVRLCTRDLVTYKEKVRETEQRLGNECIDLENLRWKFNNEFEII